jgi:hypothetical protein
LLPCRDVIVWRLIACDLRKHHNVTSLLCVK